MRLLSAFRKLFKPHGEYERKLEDLLALAGPSLIESAVANESPTNQFLA
jgi:hypothetical protein